MLIHNSIVEMATQSKNDIVKISNEESESICDLQGAKEQAKAKGLSMAKETVEKYSARPLLKSKQRHELARGEASPVPTNRGKKLVCHTASAPLPSKMSQPSASSSLKIPKSAPIQMVCAFQWPTIQEKDDRKNTLSPTRRSGASKKPHAYRKSVERQQDEMKRRATLSEDKIKITQRGKKRVCAQTSAPLPRRSPFPFVTRKPKSAPVQMAPVFHWPSIPEESDQSTSQALSVRYKYAPMQKRRVRFSKTESDGCGLSAVGEADESEIADVFDSTPTVSSKIMPKVVSRFSQKTMSTQHIARTADVEEHFGSNDVTLIIKQNKLNVSKYVHDMVRTSSPDSFVAQLIANSKNLTLYDSVESPSLKERKKKARAIGKKFG